MVYLKDGKVVESQPWSLAGIPRFFWRILNQILLFFQTLFSISATSDVTNPGKKRIGGFGGGGPSRNDGGPPGGGKRPISTIKNLPGNCSPMMGGS